jgi:Flp pilus assembly protein protease CpaA
MDACTRTAGASQDIEARNGPPPGIALLNQVEAISALSLLRRPGVFASLLAIALTSSFLAFLRFGATPRFWCLVPVFVVLAAIFVLDLRTKIIPDVLTLPGILYAFGVAAFLESPSFTDALFGAIVGGGTVLLLAVISRGAFGGGDIKLVSMLAAALGWKTSLAVLALSQLLASIFVLIILLLRGPAAKHSFFPIGAVISLLGMIALLGVP